METEKWKIGRTLGPDIMIIGAESGNYVCSVRIQQTGGGAIAEAMEPIREANAQLIVAAPETKQQRNDLLAACKNLPEPKDILAEAAYTGGDVPKTWIRDRGNFCDGYNQALKDIAKLRNAAIADAEKQ